MTIVVDASVALKWRVDEYGSEAAIVLRAENDVAAPDLLLIECRNALLTKTRRGELAVEDARRAEAEIDAVGLDIVASTPLLPHAFALALDLGQPIYDCIYLSAAMFMDSRLVTADRRFAEAVARSEFAAHVELLATVPPSR